MSDCELLAACHRPAGSAPHSTPGRGKQFGGHAQVHTTDAWYTGQTETTITNTSTRPSPPSSSSFLPCRHLRGNLLHALARRDLSVLAFSGALAAAAAALAVSGSWALEAAVVEEVVLGSGGGGGWRWCDGAVA